jgi:lipoate-protein ligase A
MAKNWRLIDSGACGASYNMALDEAIAHSVRKGAPPTLRLYGWDKPSLSLGCFQKLSDININYCLNNNIPIVRRPTGGRAILHDRELTYSFSVRTDTGKFSKGLIESYREISNAFCIAFKGMGIHAVSRNKKEKGRVLVRSPLCFQSSSFGEILFDNRKIAGSAQKRWQDALLQQGSIPYLYNEVCMRNIFGAEKTSELRKCMAGINEVMSGFKESEFKKLISASFEDTFVIRFVHSHPSEEETLLAERLECQKYLPLAGPHR